MRTKHYCKCGNEIAYTTYKYGGGKCRTCANIGENNPAFGKHPWNYIGNPKVCYLCGNTVENFYSLLCRECYLSNSDLFKPTCKKGKFANGFSTGNYINRTKQCTECKKPIKNIYATKCRSCEMKHRWDKKIHTVTSDTICEHHLDLNTENNKKSNKLRLTYKNHNLFHRYAYHYLLEKEGICGIKEYLKWFNKYIKRLEIK